MDEIGGTRPCPNSSLNTKAHRRTDHVGAALVYLPTPPSMTSICFPRAGAQNISKGQA